MKQSSKRTLVWAVSRKHSERGETIVPARTRFRILSQSNQPKEAQDPKSLIVRQLVRQLVCTMFVSSNRPSFHLW